nr:uncharacterized protein LOC123748078 [Procambarus clarkii]
MRAITQEEVEQLVNLWVEEIDNKLEELLGEQEGSSVGIESILGFYINVALIEHPIRLGSFVDYPAKLRGKGHVFNPRGEANICLMQCIAVHKCLARGLLYNDIKTRAKSGRWCRRQVRWSNNIGTPVSFDDIAKVEDLNRSSIFIYVLVKGDNGRHYISLARKGRGNFKDVISLLMLEGQHLVLIKNFTKYVRNMRSHSENIPADYDFCHSCLIALPPHQMLEHESTCEVKQTLHFPPPEKKIEFKHFGRAYGPSHTCYYDFECALQKDRPQGIIEARHRAIAYAYIIIDRRYNIVEKDFYLGPNSATHFVNKLSSSWARITREQPYYHLHMSNEQMESYKSQTMCEICDEPFGPKIVKNRHHDHSLSEHNYLAALCSRCNLQCKDGYKYLHAFSHNAAYDLGVLLNELGNVPKRNVDIMSKDGCKFMKVDIDFLRFMDSLALLNGSLAKLTKEHIDSGKPTTFTLAMLDKVPAEAHNLLLTGKQSFCYDYVSNWDVLNEPRLPPRDAFFNTLTQEELPEKEYKQALEVFKLAKCRNIGEYLVLYLKVDTGILADIFTV